MGAKRKSQATYTGGVATTSYELVLVVVVSIRLFHMHRQTTDNP